MGIITGYLSRLLADATATTKLGITAGGTSQVLLTAKTRKGYWVHQSLKRVVYTSIAQVNFSNNKSF